MTQVQGKNPLSYLGVKAENPPNVIVAARAPATTDLGHPVGTLWVHAGNEAYINVENAGGAADWAQITN